MACVRNRMSAGRRRWLSAAAVCVVLSSATGGVAGCSRNSSDDGKGSASQAQESGPESGKESGDKATGAKGSDGKLPTLGDYISQNNISETPVKEGDSTSPMLTLPFVTGWKPAGPATPPYAFAALIDTNPETAADPPTIVFLYSKLGSNADPEEILKLAPNELRNLPNFDGDKEPVRGKFAGYDSVRIGGKYTRGDAARLIGQRTVVIPDKDGLYVLQINADARTENLPDLVEATSAIDQGAQIKLPE